MAKAKAGGGGAMKALREIALRYPETEEGIACEGTAAERATVKSRKKAFLFVGVGDAMVKLRESLDEAAKLAAREPARYKVGANGWVKVTFGADAPIRVLEKWIGESYRVVVGDGGSAPAKKTAAKVPPKKAAPSAKTGTNRARGSRRPSST